MSDQRAPALAAGALAVSVALAGFGTWLGARVADTELPAGTDGAGGPVFLWAMLAFSATGALVAARRPSNPIGWLLVAEGVGWQLGQIAGDVRTYAAFTHPEAAGDGAAAWVFDVSWVAPACLLPVIVLLFPTGRLPSPRWRPVAAALAAGAVLLSVAIGLRPGPFTSTPGIDNPLGADALASATDGLEAAGNLLVAGSFVAALGSLIVRFRKGGATTRQQLKWMALAVGVVVAAWMLASVLEAFGAGVATDVVRTLPLLLIPAACAVAVLRYRLYDIDVVVNKAIVYGALAGGVVALYVTVVVGIGSLAGSAGEPNTVLSVLATAIAALAFEPARGFMQRLADRAVYGRRASPYEALTSMTRRVSAGYRMDDLLDRIARVIAEATGGRGEVWVARNGGLHRAATWPRSNDADPLPAPIGDVPAGVEATFPVYLGDQVLGALTVTKPRDPPVTPAEGRLLADLADSAAFVLDNARLVDELRGSRQRLVAAQDAERRRVERDLHDGAQQRLLELALTLRRTERQVTSRDGHQAAVTLLAEAGHQLRQALAELRDLARGIHPAILTEQGLAAAVESLAERLPLPVELDLSIPERPEPTVEATAYFVTSEAVANIVKHAGPTRARITIERAAGALRVEIADDGDGGADPRGAGLRGLADRVTALDGRLEVTSEPGRGTCVRAVLPCG